MTNAKHSHTKGTRPLALSLVALFIVPAIFACGEGGSGASKARTVSADLELEDSRRLPLGWLGAHASPLTRSLDLTDEQGEARAPGGLVLRALTQDGPLAKAGAREGDVVVRCGENWVPLKEDPTLDLVELVEREVSGGKTQLELAAWRAGELVPLQVDIDLPALEVGLPVEVERFHSGARAAIDRLVATQNEQGGFPATSPAQELVLDALAALALRSAGAAEEDAPATHARALEAVSQRVDALLAQAEGSATPASPLALALAIAELSERLGPLPSEVLLASRPRVMSFSSELPEGFEMEGLPEGFAGMTVMTLSDDDLPDHIREQIESGEFGHGTSEMQLMTADASGSFTMEGADLPEGVELPEGASLQFGEMSGHAAGEVPTEHSIKAGGDGPDLATLLEEHDPERGATLESIDSAMQPLLALQAEDGGWGILDEPEIDRLVQTSFAMVALGAAQRVGLGLEDEPVERAARYLRALAHEGKVASAVARGADRRDESGRAASTAAAFLALGCPDTDPFARALLEYSDEMGHTLVGGSAAMPFHLLATGLVRRQRGLLTWQRFYDEFRIPLVAAQAPDGHFEFATQRGTSPMEERLAGPVFDTAIGALLLGLQDERLPVLLAIAENPFAPALDGEGERAKAPAAETPELPEGLEGMPFAPGEVITIDDPEKAQELLESLGIEGDFEIEGAEGGDDG